MAPDPGKSDDGTHADEQAAEPARSGRPAGKRDGIPHLRPRLPLAWLPPFGFAMVAALGAWLGPTAALVATLTLLAVAVAVVGHVTKSGTWTFAAFVVPAVVVVAVYAFARWPTTASGSPDLGGANLHGADLQNATLRDADLSGANLTGACLAGADLRGADLKDARFIGADVSGAKVDAGATAAAIDWPHTVPTDSPCGTPGG